MEDFDGGQIRDGSVNQKNRQVDIEISEKPRRSMLDELHIYVRFKSEGDEFRVNDILETGSGTMCSFIWTPILSIKLMVSHRYFVSNKDLVRSSAPHCPPYHKHTPRQPIPSITSKTPPSPQPTPPADPSPQSPPSPKQQLNQTQAPSQTDAQYK